MPRLTVVLDAVAALREAADAPDADPTASATLAELAGADALQLGVCEELRPVGESDVRQVRRAASALELRMAPAPGLLKLALEVQPDRVVLASEASSGGGRAAPLDFRSWGTAIAPAARTLREAGIRVGALVTPELDAVKAAHAADLEAVDLYTGSVVDLPAAERAGAAETLGDAARLAAKLRLGVGLSGGLGFRSLGWLLPALPSVQRIAVGRAFAARALLVGIDRAIRDLRQAF